MSRYQVSGWHTLLVTDRPARESVSAKDRFRFARQAQALAEVESENEGSPTWRVGVFEEANRFRSRQGISELKTEPELHRYARALGLIRS